MSCFCAHLSETGPVLQKVRINLWPAASLQTDRENVGVLRARAHTQTAAKRGECTQARILPEDDIVQRFTRPQGGWDSDPSPEHRAAIGRWVSDPKNLERSQESGRDLKCAPQQPGFGGWRLEDGGAICSVDPIHGAWHRREVCCVATGVMLVYHHTPLSAAAAAARFMTYGALCWLTSDPTAACTTVDFIILSDILHRQWRFCVFFYVIKTESTSWSSTLCSTTSDVNILPDNFKNTSCSRI